MVRISDIQNNNVVWDSVPYCNIKEDEIATYLLKKMIFYLLEQAARLVNRFLLQKHQ